MMVDSASSWANRVVYLYGGNPNTVTSMANLIVQSAVKEALDENNVSADFYDALDDEVAEILEDAARRADANDRKTVQPRDL